jgi:hypothetical protein
MKSIISASLVLIISLFWANVVMADSGWTDYAEVVELVPTIHHRFRVNIAVTKNDSGCKQKQWFYQDYDVSGAREMFLTLLTAVSENKKVRVYVTGRCDINDYSEISSIAIVP